MKNSTIKKCDAGPNRSDTGRIGIKNRLKIIVTGALLLTATSAMAGLLSSPMGVQYVNPELAPVDVQHLEDDVIDTVLFITGFGGEFSLDASDVPPEFDPPASGCARFPFEQNLELVINPSLGVAEGRTHGRIATQNGTLEYRGNVRGNATCVPADGRSCDQLIVDLEMRLVLADVSDPIRPGMIRKEMLGSLLYGPDGARWASLTSNARLGGDAGLINSILESMEEGEPCGI